MDRGRLPCNLVATRPGDEIELSRELVVTVSATKHTVPSLGFVVWQRRRKLKPEFLGLAGEQIRDLRLSGVEVTNEVRTPRLAYLGDSAPEGLDACEAMYAAEVLIMELTFVAPSHRKDKIHKFGHMHLDDFLDRQRAFRQRVDHRQPFQHALPSQPNPPPRRAGPARDDGGAAAPLDLKRDQGPRRAAGFIPAVGLRHPHYQSPSSSPFQCSHVGGPLAKARRTRYLDEFAFECLPTYLL